MNNPQNLRPSNPDPTDITIAENAVQALHVARTVLEAEGDSFSLLNNVEMRCPFRGNSRAPFISCWAT
jgi:hypothetical protein